MNVASVWKETTELMFDVPEDEGGFYSALNRALIRVNTLRRAVSQCVINHRHPENLVMNSSFVPVAREGGSDLSFESPRRAKAFYFSSDGNGNAYVEKYVSGTWQVMAEITLTGNGEYREYRGFIRENGSFLAEVVPVRIRFCGEFLYNVRSVALWSDVYSENTSEIPAYSPYIEYDIDKMKDDFIGIASPIMTETENGKEIAENVTVDGKSKVMIPYDDVGVYYLEYYRELPRIVQGESVEDDMRELPIDDELASLVPVLVCAEICQDDDPDRSIIYYNRYNERAAEITVRDVNNSPVTYKNANGW